jgi:uncharacterized membrane protein
MTFEHTMENIALVFEAVGVTIIIIGGVLALITGFKDFKEPNNFFLDVRRSFGHPLILGLEVLVAADIIQTITVDPSLESVGVLGILVAVRIALSLSLDVEVDGIAPWRRLEAEEKMKARTESDKEAAQ